MRIRYWSSDVCSSDLYSMRASVGTLGLLTAIKLVPLAALLLAAAVVGSARGEIVLPQFSQIESVILLAYYAFIGFENVVETAGEMKRPKRDGIGRASFRGSVCQSG